MARRKITSNAKLDEYFERPDTPMKNSPVGSLMQAIVAESADIDFEVAWGQARQSLSNASKRRHYKVMTPKQEEKGRLHLSKWRESV